MSGTEEFQQYVLKKLCELEKKRPKRKLARSDFAVQSNFTVGSDDHELFAKLSGSGEHAFSLQTYVTLLKKEIVSLNKLLEEETRLRERAEQTHRLDVKRFEKERQRNLDTSTLQEKRVSDLLQKNAELSVKYEQSIERLAEQGRNTRQYFINHLAENKAKDMAFIEEHRKMLEEQRKVLDEKTLVETQKRMLRRNIRTLESTLEKNDFDVFSETAKFHQSTLRVMEQLVREMWDIVCEVNSSKLQKREDEDLQPPEKRRRRHRSRSRGGRHY